VAIVQDQYDNRIDDQRLKLEVRIAGNAEIIDTAELTPDQAEEGVFRFDWTAASVYGPGDLEITARVNNDAVPPKTVTVVVDENATIVGSISILSGAEAIEADGISSVLIRATVLDNIGQPAQGITVNFATTLGSVSPSSGTTDVNGMAEATLTSAANTGIAAVSAEAIGFTATVNVEFTAGVPGVLSLTALPTIINVQDESTIKVVLTDDTGIPVLGETIAFLLSTNQSGASLSATTIVTDINGQGEIKYTAGNNNGDDIITARSITQSGITDSIKIVVGGQVSLVASPQTIEANGTDTSIFQAIVLNTSGSPIAGVPIIFKDISDVDLGAADPNTFEGTDDQTTDTFTHGGGTVTFTLTHSGTSLFVVDVLNSNYDFIDQVRSTFGVLTEQVIKRELAAGEYRLEVYSNATWTIKVEPTIVSNALDDFDELPTLAIVNTNASGQADYLYLSDTVSKTVTIGIKAGNVLAQESINQIAGAPVDVAVSAAPGTLNPGSAAVVTATVVDVNNNPVSGETVTFGISTNNSGANLSAATGVTGLSGEVAVIYTAGLINNVADTVTATGAGLSKSTVLIIDADAVMVSKIELSSGAESIPADGSSEVFVRAQVFDIDGNPISDIGVVFTTTAGTILTATPVVTDENGYAQITLQSSVSPATVTVTAIASGFRATKDVKFTAGAPKTIVVTPAPQTVNPAGASTVTATLTDASGNPLSGETITFNFTANASGANLSAPSAITNINGEATVTYTAGNTDGIDIVRAESVTNTLVIGTGSITVDPDAVVVQGITVISGAAGLVADGTSTTTIRAIVTDMNGQPAQGIMVDFATTLGSVSPFSRTTDVNGMAEVTLTSAANTGIATVSAEANGFTATVDVEFTAGVPNTIVVSPAPSTVNPAGISTVTATLTDTLGNPLSGETITFNFSANASGANLSAPSAITNINGETTVTYTAGNTDGIDIVRAVSVANALVTGTGSITVDTDAVVVQGVTVISGASGLVANGTSMTTIRATVTDMNGQPVNGKTVTFTATAGTLLSLTAPTNEFGQAEVMLQSTTLVGPLSIRAECDGFIGEVSVEFVPGPADHIIMFASPPVVPPNGAFQTVAIIQDQFDNRIDDQRLKLEVRIAGNVDIIDTAEMTPDQAEDGVFRFDWIAASVYGPGNLEITARVNNDVSSDPVTVIVDENADAEMLIDVSHRVIDATGSSRSEVKVLLRDENHNPIRDAAINFSTNLGTIIGMAITGIDGYAYVDGNYPALISARQNGIATVKAWYGPSNAPYARTQTNVAFSGVTVTVTADPESLSTSEETIVEATLRVPAGDFLADQEIVLETNHGKFTPIDGGTVIGDTLFTATSDMSGKVSVKLTSTSGGTAEVTGWHAPTKGEPGETSDTKTILFSGNKLTISPAAEWLVADGSDFMLINFKLEDETGNPVENQTISLATTLGNLDNSVITGPLGEAVATLSAGTVIGDAKLTAIVEFNGVEITVTKVVPFISGVVSRLELITNPSIIKVNTGISEVRAVVRDAQGNPIHNVNVAFTIINAPGGGEILTPSIAKTGGADSNLPGQVVANFMAGSLGSDSYNDVIIEASVGNITASANLTITSEASNISLGACTTIECITDNGDGSYSIPISAVISDINGIAVPAGVEVTFAVENADMGIILSPVSTDDNGRATTILTYPATKAGNAITLIAMTAGLSERESIELPTLYSNELINIVLTSPAFILGDGFSSMQVNGLPLNGGGQAILIEVLFDSNLAIDFTGADAGFFGAMGGSYANFSAYPGADENADPSDGFVSQDYDAFIKAFAGATVESDIQKVIVKGITLTVTPEKTTILANGTSSSNIAAVLKETTTGLPIVGKELNFGVTNGSINGSAITDGSGTAQLTYTSCASDIDKMASIRCYYTSDIMASTEIALVASADVGFLLASANRNTIPNNPAETAVITVQVLDDKGHPVADGQRVTFEIDSGPGQVDASAITTDGFATATFTATPVTGLSRIKVGSGSLEKIVEIEIVETVFVVGSIRLSAATAAIPADGVSSVAITATIFDSNGDSMPNASILITTDRGSFSTAGETTITRTTNESGSIQFSLIAGDDDNSGTATIIAASGSITQKLELALVGSGDIALSASPSALNADGSSQSSVSVTILTTDGQPVSDRTRVNFRIVSGAGLLGGGWYYYSHSRQGWEYTVGGSATIRYYAPSASEISSFPETVTIEASIPGSNYDPVTTEIILSRPVEDIEVTASSLWLVADGDSSCLLTAKAIDSAGNPVPDGSRINFIIDSGTGGLPYSSTAYAYTTGGTATTTFKVSNTIGPVTIIVSSRDNRTTTSIVIDVVDEIDEFKLVAEPSIILANGSSEGIVAAIVIGADGKPVADGTRVNFNIISGSGSFVSYGTDKSDYAYTSGGAAFVTYYAPKSSAVPSLPETVTIQAYIPESSLPPETTELTLIEVVGDIQAIASPDILVADGYSTSIITAAVTDSFGNLAPDGTKINFTITSGNGGLPYTSSTKESTVAGFASVTFRVSDDVGPVTIRIASDDNSSTSTTIVIDGVNEVGDLQVTALPFEIFSSGQDSSIITVTAIDAKGSAVPDYTKVYFTLLSGSGFFNYKGNTDDKAYTAAGMASTSFYSSTAGVCSIRISDESGLVTKIIDITVKATGIGSIALSASPLTVPADGVSSTVITTTLLDTGGASVPVNTLVELTTNLGTFSNGLQTINLETVNPSGQLITPLISGTTGGVAEITARSGGVSQIAYVIIDDNSTVGQITLTSANSTLPDDGNSSTAITATVKDSLGNSVTNGTPVVLTTDLGTFQNGMTSISLQTRNGTGLVVTSLIAPTSSGIATITATSGGVSQTVTVSIIKTEKIVGSITLESDKSSIPADGVSSMVITATVFDTSGTSMPRGTGVTLVTDIGSFSASDPDLKSITRETIDDSGKVLAALISETQQGIGTIVATSGEVTQLLLVSFSGGGVTGDAEILIDVSKRIIDATGSSSSEVKALLRDSNHNPIADATISFSTNLGTIVGVATTGADGYAYVGNGVDYPELISAQQNGVATVRAWYGPTNTPYASAETNVVFSGVSITVSADPDSISTSEEAVVEAILRGPAGDL
ncbi:Ig-like domain-containing protein, partial [bacterium]|nr:Ig-like domain-containing protein [bacterium]